MTTSQPPIVLSISGHDPVGGAGIQADIEAITAQACRATTAVTCLTVQDTRDIVRLLPVEPAMVREQALTVLADLPVAAIKIGLVGSAEVVEVVAEICSTHPRLPVVFDPVLATGGGADLANPALIQAIREQLLSRITLLTPNLAEARRLSGQITADDCARRLSDLGVQNLLLTGADELESEHQVINRLHRAAAPTIHYEWPRLPHAYHGSGCTLAAACAAHLALGEDLEQAVRHAQRYTWHSLDRATRPGHGQYLPIRWTACD